MSITTPQDVLSQDLPCHKCHYNLRTLSPSQLCPECATPVSQSLEFHKHAAGINFKRLFYASSLLALLPLLYPALNWFIRHFSASAISLVTANAILVRCIGGTVAFLYAALFFAAIRLLSRSKPLRSPRTFVRVFCLAFPFLSPCIDIGSSIFKGLFVGPGNFLGAPPGMQRFMAVLDAAWVLESLWHAALCVIAWLFVRDLAKRIHRPWLATLAACSLLTLAFIFTLWSFDFLFDAMMQLNLISPFFDASRLWYVLVRQLLSLAYWPEFTLPFLFWTIVAFTARSASHTPPQDPPFTFFIDPPLTPRHPNPALADFRFSNLLSGIVILAIISGLAFRATMIFHSFPGLSQEAVWTLFNLTTCMVFLAPLAALLLATSRRGPLLRNRIRASLAFTLTLAAIVAWACLRVMLPFVHSDWWLFSSYHAFPLWLFGIVLAFSSFIFMRNLARHAQLPRLGLLTFALLGTSFSLLFLGTLHLGFQPGYFADYQLVGDPSFLGIPDPLWPTLVSAAFLVLLLYWLTTTLILWRTHRIPTRQL